jgi:hypothetical protein
MSLLTISKKDYSSDFKKSITMSLTLRLFQSASLLLCFLGSYAQNNYNLWPISGSKTGEVILSKPQEYIGDELNFDNLFIGAKENTLVFCPKNGTITNISYTYRPLLVNMMSYHLSFSDEKIDIDTMDKKNRIDIASGISNKHNGKIIDPKYVSITIGINTGKGETYYISGIRPTKYFKTGELVKRGDVIGKVGYCYWKINNPSICISRSLSSKSADPMSVFGLKTTFIQPTASKIDYLKFKHSIPKLSDAFQIYRSSLEEGHPGLYDYTSKEKMDSIFENIKSQICKPMTSEEFRYLLIPVLMSLKDSHTALYPSLYKVNDESIPPLLLGLIDNKLKIVSCINKYKAYLDCEVVKINGEDALSVMGKVKNTVSGADGFIETKQVRDMMNYFMKYYRSLYQANNGFIFDLTLANGVHIVDKFSKLNVPEPNIKFFPEEQKKFTFNKVSDKTASLSVTTFDLSQKDEEEIRTFIKSITDSDFKNLIIDIRFNRGGSGDVASSLFALFANEPFQMSAYNMVNKNDAYDFFKYTSNYSSSDGIFSEYKPISGRRGYYIDLEKSVANKPNDSIHFSGNVYVLINEYSFSAATLFAGWMVSYNRGIIIGRETGSSYYQLNAEKFAQVILGETGLELYMPLVKCVYSDKRISRIPWGRGVIPDYIVNPSIDEAYEQEDKIMKFTLDLINKTNQEKK